MAALHFFIASSHRLRQRSPAAGRAPDAAAFHLVGVVLLVAALGLIWYLYSTEFAGWM